MSYIKLKRMRKSQLVEFLIPLIEKAIKINAYWSSDTDANGWPLPDGSDPCAYYDDDANEASAYIWASLRDMHDTMEPRL